MSDRTSTIKLRLRIQMHVTNAACPSFNPAINVSATQRRLDGKQPQSVWLDLRVEMPGLDPRL